MALFDKLKGFADKAKETAKDVAGVTKGLAATATKELSKMGNSPEAQAAREEAKKAEHARIKAEMEAEKQELNAKMERIANGDPDNERWDFLESATEEQIAQLEALEAAKDARDAQNRKEARKASGYGKKLLEEACACDEVEGSGWYCVSCAGSFYANCGGGMLCERKQNHINNGTYDEPLFADSFEFLARMSAVEEGGPASKKDSFYDIADDFMETYIPHFANLNSIVVADSIKELGIGKKNYKLLFLAKMSHRPENMTEEFFVQFMNALKEPPTDAELACAYYANMEKVLENPSLYRRSYGKEMWDEETESFVYDSDTFREFRYLVRTFGNIYNPEQLQEYFTYPTVVKPDELFTDSGEIKETGIYKKDASDYDTVYGVIEYWDTKSKKMEARNG